jgi:hypothetical protein
MYGTKPCKFLRNCVGVGFKCAACVTLLGPRGVGSLTPGARACERVDVTQPNRSANISPGHTTGLVVVAAVEGNKSEVVGDRRCWRIAQFGTKVAARCECINTCRALSDFMRLIKCDRHYNK